MEAIEFQATIGEDGIISVPENIGRKFRRGKVRVILIEDDLQTAETDDLNDRSGTKEYIQFLMANPIKVDRSRPFLKREELYDRAL